MNTEPSPSEPTPDQTELDEIARQAEIARQVELAAQLEQADRFAAQLLKLANARSHFLEERARISTFQSSSPMKHFKTLKLNR